MKFKIFALVLLATSFGSSVGLAQQHWNEGQINSAFTLLDNGQEEQMIALLANWETSPHDFGIDVLQQGLGELALSWFGRLSISVSDDYLFGLAWAQSSTGDNFAALMTLSSIDVGENLVNARKHYLLGLIYWDDGKFDQALLEIDSSKYLYGLLGKDGGIQLCNDVTMAINSNQENEIVSPGRNAPTDGNEGNGEG